MKQKLEQYSFYFLPLMVFVVVAFLFFNNDLPLIEKLLNLQKENANIQERLDILSAKSGLLGTVDFAQTQKNYKDLNYILPDSKDAPGILRTIDAAASASGATIIKLDLTPGKLATESGKQSEIPIGLSVSGNFSQITGFTLELMNLGRALGIKTLSATFEKTLSTITVSYEIRGFYFSPPAVASKVDDPLSEISVNEKETLAKALKRSLLAPQIILLPSPKTDLFK